MKKNALTMLSPLAVSFLILLGCKKENASVTTDTTLTMTSTERKAPGTFSGYFTSSGDPTTSGNSLMTVEPVGMDSFHCTNKYDVPSRGTITILSDCSMTTNTGRWYVSNGTGAFANLEGKGSLVMTTTKAGGVEVLYGKTWRR